MINIDINKDKYCTVVKLITFIKGGVKKTYFFGPNTRKNELLTHLKTFLFFYTNWFGVTLPRPKDLPIWAVWSNVMFEWVKWYVLWNVSIFCIILAHLDHFWVQTWSNIFMYNPLAIIYFPFLKIWTRDINMHSWTKLVALKISVVETEPFYVIQR